MLVVLFVLMYSIMFLNVDNSSDVFLSLTRRYTSLPMVLPMAILLLLFMLMMCKKLEINAFIYASAFGIYAFALVFLRNQIEITDEQNMKAMKPSHSSAVMTSSHADNYDPEVRLSETIIQSQKEYIAQMNEIIKRLEK